MSELRIELEEGRTRFRPGERIQGTAHWDLNEAPEGLEVRLFWYTAGKGERDVGVAETVVVEASGREGHYEFAIEAPSGPHSFSGKLISLTWALELVELSSGDAGRLEVTLSHTGEEIRLGDTPQQDLEIEQP